jgi:hypothetical protein
LYDGIDKGRGRYQSAMDDVACSGALFNPVSNAQLNRSLLGLAIKSLFMVLERRREMAYVSVGKENSSDVKLVQNRCVDARHAR